LKFSKIYFQAWERFSLATIWSEKMTVITIGYKKERVANRTFYPSETPVWRCFLRNAMYVKEKGLYDITPQQVIIF